MKILIVDDQNEKANRVVNSISASGELPSDAITVVPSINDAIAKLIIEKYDLMIVDMCIPDSFAQPLQDDGGLRLIHEVHKDRRVIAPTEIIILTAHERLLDLYNKEVKKKPFDIIIYNDSSQEWEDKINDKINYLKICENSQKEQRKYDYDVAILTAVQREKEAVEKLARSWNRKRIDGDSTVYYECQWQKGDKQIKIVTTSLMQIGMVSAATISTKIIYNFAPHYLIMPGIAGGVKEEYEIGDIIIPREVKDYCSGKYVTPKDKVEEAKKSPLNFFTPTATSISTDPDIINIFASSYKDVLSEIHSRWSDNEGYEVPKIRNGYMASGDAVVQNSAVIDILIKSHLRNADALDMEAYGMYYAAQQAIKPKPIPICIKAIADFANKEKNDKYQTYAAFVSAEFMKYLIQNELNI